MIGRKSRLKPVATALRTLANFPEVRAKDGPMLMGVEGGVINLEHSPRPMTIEVMQMGTNVVSISKNANEDRGLPRSFFPGSENRSQNDLVIFVPVCNNVDGLAWFCELIFEKPRDTTEVSRRWRSFRFRCTVEVFVRLFELRSLGGAPAPREPCRKSISGTVS